MGRYPNCDDSGIKKGPWTHEEDQKLVGYIAKHGHGCWRTLPKLAGLNRCGKSCRLRWKNYLRPGIKRGKFSKEEELTILELNSILGNKWSTIASYLPGRTDNEIKNYWNTRLRKKLFQMGIDPVTHQPRTDFFTSLANLVALANLETLIGQLPIQEQAMNLQRQTLHLPNLHSIEPLDLSNSFPQNPSTLGLENQALINPIENPNSQINNLVSLDQQAPFNFQTPLNNNQINPNYSCFPQPMSESTTSLSNLGDGASSCVSIIGDFGGFVPMNWSDLLNDNI